MLRSRHRTSARGRLRPSVSDPKQKYMTDRYQKGGGYVDPHKNPWYMVPSRKSLKRQRARRIFPELLWHVMRTEMG